MNVLIACEHSGRVREAFRAKGHDAWSCDLIPSDDNSKYHIQNDIINLLDPFEQWDMMIAFPPCTYLCNSGVRWLKDNSERRAKMHYAAMFFRNLLECPVPKIAIERIGRKYDQIIQPWQFGEDASKATCLWLKGLPKLDPTKIIRRKRYANQTPTGQNKLGPSADRARLRGITYQGIADAMADQGAEIRYWRAGIKPGAFVPCQ